MPKTRQVFGGLLGCAEQRIRGAIFWAGCTARRICFADTLNCNVAQFHNGCSANYADDPRARVAPPGHPAWDHVQDDLDAYWRDRTGYPPPEPRP